MGLAALGAMIVQAAFYSLLAFAGNSRGEVIREKQFFADEVPIEVMPVLDELPLLKLGSKQKLRPKLPDMWQKREPRPVKRYEERSAPSAQAEDTVDKIPESKLADKDHEAPPEDAEIVKEVAQNLEDEDSKEEPEMNEEGAVDGSAEGTETDPLKARQVDLYRMKIAAWFNARFNQPTDTVPCEELKQLSSLVSVQVGGDRRVSGFSVIAPSGNPAFDARVQGTMAALTGQQLPPPPPLYPDLLSGSVTPRLSGRCN